MCHRDPALRIETVWSALLAAEQLHLPEAASH
jgi:hypothetical protein